MLLLLQTDESGLVESKDPGRDTPAGETVEGQGVMAEEGDKGEKEEEDTMAQQGGEEDSVRDTDKHQIASKSVGGDAEEGGQDKDKATTDMKDPEPTNGEKEGEGEREDNKKGEQVEEVKNSEAGKDGEEMKDKSKEKEKTEEKEMEEEKGVDGKMAKGAEKKKQVKEVGEKDKGKSKEAEKQGKTKRKSGSPSSSTLQALSRPRPSARSIRAAAKNDIIAKFQQGAPE